MGVRIRSRMSTISAPIGSHRTNSLHCPWGHSKWLDGPITCIDWQSSRRENIHFLRLIRILPACLLNRLILQLRFVMYEKFVFVHFLLLEHDHKNNNFVIIYPIYLCSGTWLIQATFQSMVQMKRTQQGRKSKHFCEKLEIQKFLVAGTGIQQPATGFNMNFP